MGLIRRLHIAWLELVHAVEWRWWEHKWVTVKNGQKTYGKWPKMQQATPQWKRRVQRTKKIMEIKRA